MEKYNLDEKGGLFKFVAKSPVKIVKTNDGIDLKHSSVFNYIKSTVLDVGESTLKIQSKDKTPGISLSEGDHVVLYYRASGDIYVITGEIGPVEKNDPLQVTVKVQKIEKLKDLIKEKRHCVSMAALIKIIGVPEAKSAVIKNISFGGVKINCAEDIMMEDMVDVSVLVDKMNKMPFKGRVVRKNKINSLFEYGLEYVEMTETGSKLLTRCIYEFESMV